MNERNCSVCSTPFVHVQEGRGRPPKRCPECRAGGKLPDYSAPLTETLVEVRRRVLIDGSPKVGDRVVHTGLGISPTYMTPVKILSVEGNDAVVQMGDEKLATRYNKLSLFKMA